LAKSWLRAHPEFVTDATKNAHLLSAHNLAAAQVNEEYTPAYFERVEALLGLRREQPQQRPQPQPSPRHDAPVRQPQRSNVPMSAPVHRDPPSMASGRPMSRPAPLTHEEIQVALVSKLRADESDEAAIRRYQQYKQKMNQMKAAGQLDDRR
jgi:hypothetical protein